MSNPTYYDNLPALGIMFILCSCLAVTSGYEYYRKNKMRTFSFFTTMLFSALQSLALIAYAYFTDNPAFRCPITINLAIILLVEFLILFEIQAVIKRKLLICWRHENKLPLTISRYQMSLDSLMWLGFSVIVAILLSSITFNQFWPAMALFLPYALGFLFFHTKLSLIYLLYLNEKHLRKDKKSQEAA